MRVEVLENNLKLNTVGIDLKQTADYHAGLINKGADVKGRFEEAARDIRTYEAESLEDNIFSFYPYFIQDVGGERRIRSGEVLAISQINPLERKGAVVEGFGKLEKKIGKIKDNGFFLWISPDGDADLLDIHYRYHQIYMGEVNRDTIQACALKCDLDENILSRWLTRMSGDTVMLEDRSARSFITNPIVIQFDRFRNGSQESLQTLKEILDDSNTNGFYKGKSIDYVMKAMSGERLRQEFEVNNIAATLLKSYKDFGEDDYAMKQALGMQLYNLYDRYQDQNGNITLTGCAGGDMQINDLMTKLKIESNNEILRGILQSVLQNPIDIFSTNFRVIMAGGQSEKFTCPECKKTADGPVGETCPNCQYTLAQFKIDHPELVCE